MVLEHEVQESWMVGVDGQIKERGAKRPIHPVSCARPPPQKKKETQNLTWGFGPAGPSERHLHL